MTKAEALNLPFARYLEWCRAYMRERSKDPMIAYLLSMPFSQTFLEAQWAKDYWFHRCESMEVNHETQTTLCIATHARSGP